MSHITCFCACFLRDGFNIIPYVLELCSLCSYFVLLSFSFVRWCGPGDNMQPLLWLCKVNGLSSTSWAVTHLYIYYELDGIKFFNAFYLFRKQLFFFFFLPFKIHASLQCNCRGSEGWQLAETLLLIGTYTSQSCKTNNFYDWYVWHGFVVEVKVYDTIGVF